MMPEKIFNEWLHNFHFKSRRNSKYGSLKRRSSKKENMRNQVDANDGQEHDENKELTPSRSLKNKSRSNRHRRSKNSKNKNDW